jgi:hypothetical protein
MWKIVTVCPANSTACMTNDNGKNTNLCPIVNVVWYQDLKAV